MTMTPLTHANGTVHPAPPWLAFTPLPSGPAMPWPRHDDTDTAQGDDEPEPAPVAAPRPSRMTAAISRVSRLRAPGGDTIITWSMTFVVSAVILFAAIVSYTHVHSLAAAHHEDGVQSHLLPLSLDGVIAEASLVMLFAARHKPMRTPPLARVMLWAGITATLGANALVALPPQWVSPVANAVIGAALSAWPAAAFIGSVELVMRLVRDVRAVASARDTEDDSDSDTGAPETTGQGGGGGDTDDGARKPPRAGKPRRPATRRTTADPVDAAIKKGWDDDKITATLSVTKRTVQRHRAALAKAARK